MENIIRKANKARNAARSDFWEAGYLFGEYRARKDAKRRAKRAERRINRALAWVVS